MSAAASARAQARRARRADGTQPKNRVRARSFAAGGDWERGWFTTWSPGELSRYMRVIRPHRDRLYRAWRARRARPDPDQAPIPTAIGLRILEQLVAMAAGGRRLLVASYRELAARAGCSLSAVHEQLARLRACGMVDWQRRCRPTEAERAWSVPQWEQAENVYRLLVPAGVKKAHRRSGAEADADRAKAGLARGRIQRARDLDPAARRRLIEALDRLRPANNASRE